MPVPPAPAPSGAAAAARPAPAPAPAPARLAPAGRPPPRPFFFALPRDLLARRIPPIPGMLPIICFIIFWPSRNRTMSWLTSPTVTPDPAAIRARRDPLMIFGFRRSSLVIELTMAAARRSEEHTSELQSRRDLVCRL